MRPISAGHTADGRRGTAAGRLPTATPQPARSAVVSPSGESLEAALHAFRTQHAAIERESSDGSKPITWSSHLDLQSASPPAEQHGLDDPSFDARRPARTPVIAAQRRGPNCADDAEGIGLEHFRDAGDPALSVTGAL